ncbi:transcription factor bHLH106-like [Lycium barbarum]|uniref:transcription factor bHLH106-like n=1 Tax=Lycium barbarum TaxID=112863 RepID=UPI00293F670E|nr:transcription factor bHLH106-like [Lycium barbarum]
MMQQSENLDYYNYLATGEYSLDFPVSKSYSSCSFYPEEDGGNNIGAASKNIIHKEAERRRRERINSHLNQLRTLLPANSKIDKASLLAKVVQRVRDLKEQTSKIMQFETNFPSENDEITVLSSNDTSSDGRLLIKASICCEDRFDLMPNLIETLKSLRLTPLRAEVVTLGGRIRNVIILAADKDYTNECLLFVRDALMSSVQSSSNGTGQRGKRRRVLDQEIAN